MFKVSKSQRTMHNRLYGQRRLTFKLFTVLLIIIPNQINGESDGISLNIEETTFDPLTSSPSLSSTQSSNNNNTDRVETFLNTQDELETESPINKNLSSITIVTNNLDNMTTETVVTFSEVNSSNETVAPQLTTLTTMYLNITPTRKTSNQTTTTDEPIIIFDNNLTTTEESSTIDWSTDANNNTFILINETSTEPAINQTICNCSSTDSKFFLLTIILLSFCCLLIIIILILVGYIYRKLSRKRTIKMPNKGSVEFETIKDGRFHQWHGNVNTGYDVSTSDLSDPRHPNHRFLEGSVVPYSERFSTVDLNNRNSTQTFGHHHSHQHHNSPSPHTTSYNNQQHDTIDTRL